ncbi:MAG: AMP-binding protein, partial [Fusobacteriaceae bacterium]
MDFIANKKKKALAYNNVEYSYAELIGGAKYFATQIEICEGDRVLNFMENRPEFIYSFFGVWDKRGVAINLDAGYTSEQVAYVLSDSTPKYIFTSETNFDVATEAKKIANSDAQIINVDKLSVPKNYAKESDSIKTRPADETVVILYTSGTTGDPKGVMLTFDNLMSNMEAAREIEIIAEKDTVLAMLPFHHVLPLTTTLLMPVHFGAYLVILKELSSDAIKDSLGRYKVTVVIGVPRIWEMFHKGIMLKINSSGVIKTLFKIAEKVNSIAFSKKIFKKVHETFGGNIKVFASGGAKLDAEITKNFRTLGFKMVEGYGLTETSPIIAFNRPNNIRAGTVGEIIPRVEVKISEDGEILARGANVMKGYYNKPEETAESIDKDGWFHTGDLGILEDGFLTITGRKKEMIVLSNGKNINPADIEIELSKDSDIIKEVAVIENNNHLMALIFPDFELAKSKGIVNIKEALKWQIIDKYNVEAP